MRLGVSSLMLLKGMILRRKKRTRLWIRTGLNQLVTSPSLWVFQIRISAAL